MIEISRPSVDTLAELNNLSTLDDVYQLLCDFVDHSPGMLEMRLCRNSDNPDELIDWNFYPHWQSTPDKALQKIVLARASSRTSKHILNKVGFMLTQSGYIGYHRFGIKIKNENLVIAGEAFYSHRDTGGYWLRLISFTLNDTGRTSL